MNYTDEVPEWKQLQKSSRLSALKTLATEVNSDTTIKPVLSSHPLEMAEWPLNRGWPLNTGIVNSTSGLVGMAFYLIPDYLLYFKIKNTNRGAGYGLEVSSCEYHFKGDNFLCNWLKEKLVKDQFEVQCWHYG